jgi:dTDP-4-amino-4,6-dideoxygalactose transaminase
MCFTDDAETDGLLRSIRSHGQGEDRYENVRLGINGRLDTLQAAVLLAKLDGYAGEIAARQKVAARYTALLKDVLTTPAVPARCESVWAQYTVLSPDCRDRDRLRQALQDEGVPTAIYYPKPLHLQKVFEQCGYSHGTMPVSEDAGRRVFSLPMHPFVRQEDQERAAACLHKALAK